MLNVNYGCGETKLEGFVNVDTEESTKPDLIVNIKTGPFPWETNSVDKFYAIHVIEHIEEKHWPMFFNEVTRVLKVEGELVLAYPEFEVCVKNYLENVRGMRDLWKATLYGRQLYPGDYHVTPVTTSEVVSVLKGRGFSKISWLAEEPSGDHYTMLRAYKVNDIATRASVTGRAIFGDEFKSKPSEKFKAKT